MTTDRGGRARGAAREQAILDAVLELLTEVGYDRMSMDAVAARARSSKATIYRRWPGKAELVVAALERLTARRAVAPQTGSLRGDLLGTLRAMRDGLSGQDAELVLGLLTAMRRDDGLARTVRERMIDDKREAFGQAISRAQARGELPASVDRQLLAEVSSSILFSRMFVTGQPLDEALMVHLVDDVLLPLLDHQAGRR